jgi:23S rRNA (cytosine1962-C5)-methyltransferase
MDKNSVIITEKSPEYELLDYGSGEKLERFGGKTLSRPDPQALWHKTLDEKSWKSADGIFSRAEKGADWILTKEAKERWPVKMGDLSLYVKPTAFKHVGIFPEQSVNWTWMQKQIVDSGAKDIEVLNLFAYTGGASLACAKAGAKVVHVDSSKVAVQWARDNAVLSGLDKAPVRWILDDVRDFVKREIKRDRKYDAIIMDPPAFGHGPSNELWKIEDDFLPLVDACISLLKDQPLFFLLNGYSAGYSALAYGNNLRPLTSKFGGILETGELAIRESSAGRLLPAGIFARWSK